MGSMSIWHWLIVLVVVLLLFGAGKIPKLMGDMAKGVTAFKKGLKDGDGDEDATKPADGAAQVTAEGTVPAATTADVKKEAKV